jgi:hypothetical protein
MGDAGSTGSPDSSEPSTSSWSISQMPPLLAASPTRLAPAIRSRIPPDGDVLAAAVAAA